MQLPSALLGRSSKKKAFLIFLEMESCTFWAQAWRKKSTWENFLYSGKLLLISQKLFLHFGKWKPRKKFLIFQETETPKNVLIFRGKWNCLAPGLKSILYFRWNFQSPQNQTFWYFSKKSYEWIFLKTLSDNSFHLFYKVNRKILLVYKNTESFLLC